MSDPPIRLDESPRFDFSEFHPLMHSIFSQKCKHLPGGRKRHLALTWEHKIMPALARRTTCRIGWHEEIDAWSRDTGIFKACFFCGKRMGV